MTITLALKGVLSKLPERYSHQLPDVLGADDLAWAYNPTPIFATNAA